MQIFFNYRSWVKLIYYDIDQYIGEGYDIEVIEKRFGLF